MVGHIKGVGMAGIAAAMALMAADSNYRAPDLLSLRDLAAPPAPPKKPENPAGTKFKKRLKAGKKLWRV